jgi:hypothetical protein
LAVGGLAAQGVTTAALFGTVTASDATALEDAVVTVTNTATGVWAAFNYFMADNYDALVAEGHSPDDIERLPADELITRMQAWVVANS